jgi:hypothetical protein
MNKSKSCGVFHSIQSLINTKELLSIWGQSPQPEFGTEEIVGCQGIIFISLQDVYISNL